MIQNLLSGAVTAPPADSFSLNGLVSGGAGAVLMGAVIWLGKLLADRYVPSRSDARANVNMVLEGLNNMVKVLQEEKLADASRLDAKQKRIDVLERESDKDYDRISELRTEVIDLRNRLGVKDRHINTLVRELRKLGAQVTGLDLPDADVEVTMDLTEQVSKVRITTGPIATHTNTD